MDYVSMMGLELDSAVGDRGRGVRIAILDSGTPLASSGISGLKYHSSSRRVPDTFGHATAIASMLAGGRNIGGICKNADLYYVPVLDEYGSGTVDSVSKGIYDAIRYDVDIINLSAGFARTDTCPKALEKACKAAFDAGKTIICAAGNDGGMVNWPAALETTISVGASDKNGLKTSFSSSGEIDFVAPGVDLYVLTKEGETKKVSGTSFSTAIVSGVAALLLSQMGEKRRNRHSAGMKTVVNAIRTVSRDVDAPGWDEMTGYGAILGKNSDPTVCMEIKKGFFGRIVSKLQSIFGFGEFGNKEIRDGRV